MTTDPHSPSYVPQYTGASGDYGSGTEFGGDLFALYTAGQLTIPATAGHYSAAASQLHWIVGTFQGIASDLGHSAGDHVVANMQDLSDAMRLTTDRLYVAGDALVEIADRYAQTDEGAAAEFGLLLDLPENAPMFENPPVTTPPPGPDDPIGPTPDLPQDNGELDDLIEEAGLEDELAEDEADQDSDDSGEDGS